MDYDVDMGWAAIFLHLAAYSGGCQPASTQMARARTRNSLLRDNAATVARPVGV